MAFKGLADRYEATYKDLYELPIKTQKTDEPFLSFRPDDPKRDQTKHDSQQIFPGTIERETLRLGRYLKSNRGMMFIVRQAELQTGNTFSETRIFNPLFVTSGIVPFVHVQRSLDSALASPMDGTNKSPASDGQMGSAGRLQLATKNKVIADRMGAKGGTGLLNLILPGNPLSRAVSGVMNAVGERGIVAVDTRPEIDFQGEYFAVATWRGFSSVGKDGDPIKSATNQLLHGDIKGAGKTLLNGLKTKVFGSAGTLGTLTNTTGGRGGTSTQYAGYRYFITHGSDETSVDRYLSKTIEFESISTGVAGQFRNVPRASMDAFVRTPHLRTVTAAKGKAKVTTPATSLEKKKQELNKVLSTIKKVATTLFGSNNKVNQFISPLEAKQITVDTSDPNPGRARMIYPELSLESRYDAQKESMASTVDEQITGWKKTYNPSTINKFGGFRGTAETTTYGKSGERSAGFVGGLTPDYQTNLNSLSHTKAPSYVIGDPLNANGMDAIIDNKDSKSGVVSSTVLKDLRDRGGNLIDFMFYDFVNTKVLPFRAFLTDIAESISPNVSDQPYIGRLERNIVYIGVMRELSFTFRIQAFSASEMDNVWKKINYLTGLAYPSKYADGFMVPPLVKLTIGDVYKDQPGYIKSMSYKFDDDDWEIDVGNQVPMGVTVNIAFSVIEKQQMSTKSTFYPYDGEITIPGLANFVMPDIPDIVIPTSIPNIGTATKPATTISGQGNPLPPGFGLG